MMDKFKDYSDLLYLQIKVAAHGEDLLESALPALYQRSTSPSLKAVIKQLMDANKVHQDLLDTAALSLSAHSDKFEHKNLVLESLLDNLEAITHQEQKPINFFSLAPILQKIIHQQMADFEILSILTKQTGHDHLADDFKGLKEGARMMLGTLQNEWATAVQ